MAEESAERWAEARQDILDLAGSHLMKDRVEARRRIAAVQEALRLAEQREAALREALAEVRARVYELCITTLSDDLRGKLGVKAQQKIDAALAARQPESEAS